MNPFAVGIFLSIIVLLAGVMGVFVGNVWARASYRVAVADGRVKTPLHRTAGRTLHRDVEYGPVPQAPVPIAVPRPVRPVEQPQPRPVTEPTESTAHTQPPAPLFGTSAQRYAAMKTEHTTARMGRAR